jgi:hypothetical protein
MKRIFVIVAMMKCMRDLRADCPGGSAAAGWSIETSCMYGATGFTVDNTGSCSGLKAVGFELPNSESIDSDTKGDYQFSCSAS